MKKMKFTDKHIEQILEGSKWSTLRTIKKKNFYPTGVRIKLEGTDKKILVRDRYVLNVSEDKVDNPDKNSEFNPTKNYLATMEGFDSYSDLIDWFKSRNYNLPQPMFLYMLETDLDLYQESHKVQPQIAKKEVNQSKQSGVLA